MGGLLRQNGVPDERADGMMDEALAHYASFFLCELERAEVRALEGARELIGRMGEGRTDCVLGLLTGNLEALVSPKLKAAGLPPAGFRLGAFGSDNTDRNELPAIATLRAEAYRGKRILPGDVAIVGDTPLDVECARRFGAIPIAVATRRL